MSRTFWEGGACVCVNNVSTQAPPPKWNMPKQITTRCRRRDDAIFDDATISITTRYL
jgi:hypothetical protein